VSLTTADENREAIFSRVSKLTATQDAVTRAVDNRGPHTG
jgi:hypothetical protein